MKKIVIILLLVICYSCSNGEDSNPENINNSIYGNWEMYSYVYDNGEDFFEDMNPKEYLHQLELISPNTYIMRYPSNDDSYTSEEIGKYELVGTVLTLNSKTRDGAERIETNIMTEFEVSNGIMKYKENLIRNGHNQYGVAYYKKVN